MLYHFQWKSQAYTSHIMVWAVKNLIDSSELILRIVSAETFTNDTPWKQLLINFMTLVTWPKCLILTRNHFCWHQQQSKNDIMNEHLLSRELSDESFKPLPHYELILGEVHFMFFWRLTVQTMILKKNFLKNVLPRRDMSCSQNGNIGKFRDQNLIFKFFGWSLISLLGDWK